MAQTDSDTDTSGSYRTEVGHCKADETDVYVGRGPNGRHMESTPHVHQRGWLGNPYPVDNYGREESLRRFMESFRHKLSYDPEFREAVGELAGSVLGCWCQRLDEDEPACHAEIIAEHAERIARDVDTDS